MKKLLYVLLALALIVGVAIAGLVFFIDPNQFKDQITQQVQKTTGQELVINGDISWQLFPSLGFTLGPIALKNPQGFAEENLVKFSGASLSVSVTPLLSNKLDIGNIELNQARIFLQTLKDGRTNLDALKKAGQKESTENASDSTSTNGDKANKSWTITVAGISVKDANIVILDDKAGTSTKINKLNFALDHFAPGEWSSLSFDVVVQKDTLNLSAQGKTQLLINKEMDNAEVKSLAFTSQVEDGLLKIDSASLNIDQVILGKPSNIDFVVTGSNADLKFDNEGSVTITADKDFAKILLQNLTISSQLTSPDLPKGSVKTKLSATGAYTATTQLAELTNFNLTINDTSLSGTGSFKAGDIPVVRVDLTSKNIDLDQLLALETVNKQDKASTPTEHKGQSKVSVLSDVEPDLSALKTIDFKANVDIAKFKANNIHITDIISTMVIKGGIAEMINFSAQLYEGKINASARVNAKTTPASYTIKKNLNGVQALPLLKDLTDKKLLSGTMNLMVNLSGTGLSQKKLRSGITGSIVADVLDGAIWGVNIPKMVRKASGVIKGTESLASVTTLSEDEKTDFSAMKMTMNLGKGIASTNDLLVTAPFIQISGEGQSNLLQEDLDFLIKTKISKSIKKQEDVELYALKDSTIPMSIKGTWQEPKVQLAVEDLLKERAQQEVQKGLDKIFKKADSTDGDTSDKTSAEKLIKGLFN